MSSQRIAPRTDQYGEPAAHVPTLTETRYSQSLERGLAILACFNAERQLLGIADIADELGMSRSTTHRYVLTLTKLGYLKQDTRRKYRLTVRVTTLGMAAMGSTTLREHARPLVEELVRRCGFTVILAALDGSEIVLLDCVQGRRGPRRIGVSQEVGSRLPVWCTAAGKLLVAQLPEPVQQELIREMKLKKRGPKTIMSKGKLRKELIRVRDESLVVGDEELAEGRYSIAAPVRSSCEVIAAVGFDAHISTISLKDLLRLGPHLISVADHLSARLGYRRADERPSLPCAGGAR
jgi:IclR family pca regulon transcriptional regulator